MIFLTTWQIIPMKSRIFRYTLLLIALFAYAREICAREYLVSIGINDYTSFSQKLSNLLLPVSDSKAVANLYASHGSVDYVLLTDNNATRDKILNAMRKVYANASVNDRIVFFFSGHGYNDGICAYDEKLSYDDIKNELREYPSVVKIVLVDACYSGSIRKVIPSNYNKKAVDTEFVFFLASRTNESSIERRDMSNGFFTEYLIRGLKGNSDVNRDKQITAKELFDFVQKRVAIQSDNRQHPVMWGNYSDTTVILNW